MDSARLDALCARIRDGHCRVVGWGTPRHLPFLLTRSPFPVASVIDGFLAPEAVDACAGVPILAPDSLAGADADRMLIVLFAQERHWPAIMDRIAQLGKFACLPFALVVARYEALFAPERLAGGEIPWPQRYRALFEDQRPNQGGGERRIALWVHGLCKGGAERQIVLLAIGLRRLGWEVVLITLNRDVAEAEGWADDLARAGVWRHFLPDSIDARTRLWPSLMPGSEGLRVAERLLGAFDLEAMFPILSTCVFLQRNPCQAMISYLDNGNLMAATAALLANVPRVHMSCRNVEPNQFPSLRYFCIDKPLLRDAYRVLLDQPGVSMGNNSLAGARSYGDWLGLPPGTIAVLPNAVAKPSVAASADVRAEFSIPAEAPLILGIMRLDEEKQPLAFIRVVARVLEKLPETRAILVGDGPALRESKALVGALGLADRLLLAGLRDGTGAFIEAADLLLLTSRQEGMPNVVLEAQAQGRPVVATDVGGVREATAPVLWPMLCRFGDLDGLAERCLGLLRDRAGAAALGWQAASEILRDRDEARLARNTLAACGLGQTEGEA